MVAPADSPPMMLRWKIRKTTIIGRLAIASPAMNSVGGTWLVLLSALLLLLAAAV